MEKMKTDGLDVTSTGVRGAKTDARLQTLALRNSLCSSERWGCVIIKNTADKCCDTNYGRQRHPSVKDASSLNKVCHKRD